MREYTIHYVGGIFPHSLPRPPKGSKKLEPPPQSEPIPALGKLVDYLEVPFFGSFGGSGY